MPIVSRLATDHGFLDAVVGPLLTQRVDHDSLFVARRYDSPDGACSLQVFVWPPGSCTQIHDHSSWGAFCCVVGAIHEDRYVRLDDGARPFHAHLKRIWRRMWLPGAGVSTLLPYGGGIHQVMNPTGQLAVSLHVYGPPGEIDGRDYDPTRDYVCDRLE